MEPYQGGGEMIHTVGAGRVAPGREVPHKFEAGTPNIAGADRHSSAAVDYLTGIGMDAVIQSHERELMAYALEKSHRGSDGVHGLRARIRWTSDSAVDLFHAWEMPTPTTSRRSSTPKASLMRAGHHCAQLVMNHFGVSATARASFYIYNTTDDVDRLVEGLSSP